MNDTPDLAAIARELAAQGLFVFPTVPGGKAPAIAGGHKAASDDPKAVLKMFRSVSPHCGIAVSLKASGLVAIDWDKYKGDKEDEAWVEGLEHDQLLNGCLLHKSPQGGYHFILDDGGVEKFPGHAGLTIDIKHDGYVLWPPTNGYERVDGSLEDVATIPDELVQEIEAASKALRKSLGASGTGAMMFSSSKEAYAALEKNIEGRRHDALMRITLDARKEQPGADTAELVQQVAGELRKRLGGKNDPRYAEILDTREGGELWRLLDRAGDLVVGHVPSDMIDAVRAKVGRLQPVTGKPAPGYTTWTSEEELQRQEDKIKAKQIQQVALAPFQPGDPKRIEPTRWVYGSHYIEGVVSVTAAPGGAGKSLLTLTDALCIATGRELLGQKVHNKARVLYWNGEDSRRDLEKRCLAACMHHQITNEELGGRLILADKNDLPLNLVTMISHGQIKVNDAQIDNLKERLVELDVEVMIIDPFVSCHSADENSNSQMEQVMAALREIAQDCEISVEVVHHTTKGVGAAAQQKMTADAVRGASAVINAARAVRVLQPIPDGKLQYWNVPEESWGNVIQAFGVKANQAPVSSNSCLFMRQGLSLGNGDARHPLGDSIVVAQLFTPPEKPAMFTQDQMIAAVRCIGQQDIEFRRHSTLSPHWMGWPVARAMKLDAGEGISKPDLTPLQSQSLLQVKALLQSLLSTGVVHLVDFEDGARRLRKCYELTATRESIEERIASVFNEVAESMAEEL